MLKEWMSEMEWNFWWNILIYRFIVLVEGLEVFWGEGREVGVYLVLGCFLVFSLKLGGGRV